MRSHGRHKVMFGTNYPMIMPDAALRDIDSPGLDNAAREAFLHGNAERVFDIETPATT
jgi:uncharacterized protein